MFTLNDLVVVVRPSHARLATDRQTHRRTSPSLKAPFAVRETAA